MVRIAGIDLGTTNSVMALDDGHGLKIIPNNLGQRLTPSIVHFAEDGEILVGQPARRATALAPDRSVFSVKRQMGTAERIKVAGYERLPQEISAIILQKLKYDMEEYLGEPVEEAVITVPAYFTDTQRQATLDAGEIAGFHVRRIIDEPTAAAIAYGLDKGEDQILMVFDFGGGTFDVSIIEVMSGVFQVLAIRGNNLLGGDDFDKAIVDWMLTQLLQEQNLDLSQDKEALYKMRMAAETAKIELSQVQKTSIVIEALKMTQQGPVTLDLTLTRTMFEELVHDLANQLVEPCHQVIEEAGLEPGDITNVVLVGGSTRVPLVRKIVREAVPLEPRSDVNPDEVVAMGAAIQASLLTSAQEELEATAADHYDGEPQEQEAVIIHVTPFSLGVGVEEDLFEPVIERNNVYPCEATKEFTTTRDFQEAISFPIYEGEDTTASANTFLDMIRIDGLPAAPKGVPRVELSLRLDRDRILHASAIDKTSGKTVHLTVQSTNSRLTNEQKAILAREARMRANDMLARKQRDQLFNQADGMIFKVQQLLAEVQGAEVDHLHKIMIDIRKHIESDDEVGVRKLMEQLSQELQQIENVTEEYLPSDPFDSAGEQIPEEIASVEHQASPPPSASSDEEELDDDDPMNAF